MVSLATLLSHFLQLSEVITLLTYDIAIKPVADLGNWIHTVLVKHVTDMTELLPQVHNVRTIGDIGDIPTGLPLPTSPPLSLLAQVRPRQEQFKDRHFDIIDANIRLAF